MRTIVAFVVIAVASVVAQEAPRKEDPARTRIEVTGCVKGSTLTETSLRVSGARDENPARRWGLRGSKATMDQLKKHAGHELEIVGTTSTHGAGTPVGRKRIGGLDVSIGGNTTRSPRDPLPEQPTIDVERFALTGEQCDRG